MNVIASDDKNSLHQSLYIPYQSVIVISEQEILSIQEITGEVCVPF